MNLTLKLYAMLSDYLPAEARKSHEVALTLVEDATAGALMNSAIFPRSSPTCLAERALCATGCARAHTLSEGDVLASGQP
jgi:sulfur-carrier protein